MKQRKPLGQLTLFDRFLFAEAMEKPGNLQILLEIILGRDIDLKNYPQSEREIRTTPLKRFVKLDVWSQDDQGTVYNAEAQRENTGNLPKRSRYYQGMIDSKLLEPGEIDFRKLNQLYVIIITPFDLFGAGKYQYTFQMKCEEVPGLNLEDGVTRIFLNSHGTDSEGVSEELIELLHYIEHTNEKTEENCKSDRIKKLKKQIDSLKENAEVSVRYMQAWEERIMEQKAAREEGLIAGKQEGIVAGKDEKILELIQKKLKKGKGVELIADELEETTETIQKFIRKMKSNEKI